MHRIVSKMRFLLPFLFLLAAPPYVSGQCQFTMWAYNTAQECNSQLTPPPAIGEIIADGTCRTQTSTPANADMLPGTYVARCNSDGLLEFPMSGCTASDCSGGSSSGQVCARDLTTISSYYSLLNQPFEVQDRARQNTTFFCFRLTTSAGEVTFAIFGDCSDPVCSLGPGETLAPVIPPTPAPVTPQPTQSPVGPPTGCTLCGGEGVTLGAPNKKIVSSNQTCGGFDTALGQVPLESCPSDNFLSNFDLRYYCECQGTTAPSLNCSLCGDANLNAPADFIVPGSGLSCEEYADIAEAITNEAACQSVERVVRPLCCDSAPGCTLCPQRDNPGAPTNVLPNGQTCIQYNQNLTQTAVTICPAFFANFTDNFDAPYYCECDGVAAPDICSLCGGGSDDVVSNPSQVITDPISGLFYTCSDYQDVVAAITNATLCGQAVVPSIAEQCCDDVAGPLCSKYLNDACEEDSECCGENVECSGICRRTFSPNDRDKDPEDKLSEAGDRGTTGMGNPTPGGRRRFLKGS